MSFRAPYRVFLIAVLSLSLAAFPVGAAANPVGIIVSAVNAHLGGSNAAIGADVYTGDFLDTDQGGALRLKVGSTQVYLSAASAATFDQQADHVSVKLVRGTIGFSSAVSGKFQLETPVGIVRAADGRRAFGEVTITGPQKIMVAAYHGALVVEGSGVSRTIKEGDAYNVTFSDEAASDTGPSSADSNNASVSRTSGRRRRGPGSLAFSLIAIGGTGAAGLGYFFWHHFAESDSTPQT